MIMYIQMTTTTIKIISLFSILNHFVSVLYEQFIIQLLCKFAVTDLGCCNGGFCNSSTYRRKRTRERERGEITKKVLKQAI